MEWYQAKLFMSHLSGFSMDALHVIVGVGVQFLLAALLRVPVSRLIPWLAVLALALANEANDLAVEIWPDPGMQWGESAKDILLTMLLPSLIMLSAKYRPQLFLAQSLTP